MKFDMVKCAMLLMKKGQITKENRPAKKNKKKQNTRRKSDLEVHGNTGRG